MRALFPPALFSLMLWLLSPAVALAQQSDGSTAIPDGLDCNNLTADQEDYRAYCEDAEAMNYDAPQKIAETYQARLDAASRVFALKEKGWTALEAGNYEDARALFTEALALNVDNTRSTSRDYHDTHLRAAIETAEHLVQSPARSYGYWEGQEADRESSAEGEQPSVTEEAATEERPWHNVKYACYGQDKGRLYEGLEITQTVENSGPNWLDVNVTLRFNDLHPRYHRHVFVDKFTDFEKLRREDWYALAYVRNGMEWTSPTPVRIPRQWSATSGSTAYTATWDDALKRYRFTLNGRPYDEAPEMEMFAVHVECYRHDPEPRGQDRYRDSFDGVPNIVRF